MIGETLCSGIGAPEMAAPWVDWRLAAEVEPFPRAVLKDRFGYRQPASGNESTPVLWSDMTALRPRHYRRFGVPFPDIIVAGTPCQDFSIAGLRQGLRGARGNITMEFVRHVHAIQSARPDGKLAVLWENVPGVLSDKSNAFGCFLAGIVGAQQPFTINGSWPVAGMVSGPRARAAWIVRDAQYFGLAQRRRRVFVVIDFGGSCDPAEILFERRSVSGYSPPRREESQDVAGTLGGGSQSGGFRTTDLDNSGAFVVEGHHGDVAGTVTSKWSKGSGGPAGNETQNLVAFDCKGSQVQTAVHVSPPLRAMGHNDTHANAGGHAAIAIQERATSTNESSGPGGAGFRADDCAYTLEARTASSAVAFKPSHFTRGKDGAPSGVFPPLSADADRGDQDPVVAFDLRGRDGGAQFEGPHNTANIRAGCGGSSRSYVAGAHVRRLTPVECARLQGFPDNHTAITYRGKPAADGPQYKAYGNSMAVPCIAWIMDRMRLSLEAHQ